MITLSTPWSTPDPIAKVFTEWFPVNQPPVLKDLSPEEALKLNNTEIKKSEQVLVVDIKGRFFLGHYWTPGTGCYWREGGWDAGITSLERSPTEGPNRLMYWCYLPKKYPPLS